LANGELAINITDGKLYYKDNIGSLQVIGWKVVPATAGGTGITSYAIGDILYANTTTTLAKIADVATGNALISGGVSTAPTWGKIGLTSHVSGTLPIANGGTNTTTVPSNGELLIGNGTGYSVSALTAGSGITITNASGSITIASGGASYSSSPVTATSNYTITTTDSWVINNKTGSSLVVTLPSASAFTGRELTFQNYQAYTTISASSNVVPQGGGAAGTAILAASIGDSATLVSDGTNWIMMRYVSYNNLLLE
jgi:hypothetical protein